MTIPKKKIGLLGALILSMTISQVMPVHANSDIKLMVNYIQANQGARPILKNGNTLVPIRVISESLGATVDWNAKEKQINISHEDTNIEMTIANPQVKVNDLVQTIPAPPIIHEGATMLPIRFVAEALDAKVDWNSQARTVTVMGKALTKAPAPKFTHDQWGRKVRTTDLPRNAGIFPYIVHGVPNWVYESINMTAPSLLSQSKIKSFPSEFFYSGYDHQKAITLLDKHFQTVLNVNYQSINREQFKKYVQNTFNQDSFKSTGFSNLEWADAFVDHVISNKIIVTGSARVLPEMFWVNEAGDQVVSAHVTLKVVQQGGQGVTTFQDFGSFPSSLGLTAKIPYLKTGKTYEGLVQFRLIDGQIDYQTNSIRCQIHPDANGFGGAYTEK